MTWGRRVGAREGGEMRWKERTGKPRKDVRGVRYGKNEPRYCISEVGGSWKEEGVKVDLVWV